MANKGRKIAPSKSAREPFSWRHLTGAFRKSGSVVWRELVTFVLKSTIKQCLKFFFCHDTLPSDLSGPAEPFKPRVQRAILMVAIRARRTDVKLACFQRYSGNFTLQERFDDKTKPRTVFLNWRQWWEKNNPNFEFDHSTLRCNHISQLYKYTCWNILAIQTPNKTPLGLLQLFPSALPF